MPFTLNLTLYTVVTIPIFSDLDVDIHGLVMLEQCRFGKIVGSSCALYVRKVRQTIRSVSVKVLFVLYMELRANRKGFK